MRDKLIELLKVPMCDEGDCENCEGLESGALCDKVYYGKRADYLIANGVTLQQWIPVSERLPELFVSVLVYTPKEAVKVREGFIVNSGNWYNSRYDHEPVEVTHWMPMPEPPKEDE